MQHRNVEVEQQAAAEALEAKVSEQLCAVDRKKMLDCFQLDGHWANNEVDSIPAVERAAAVDRWDRDLTSEVNATEPHFFGQAFLVCGFEETGSQFPMNLDGRADDVTGQPVPVIQVLSKQYGHFTVSRS